LLWFYLYFLRAITGEYTPYIPTYMVTGNMDIQEFLKKGA